MVTSSTVPQCLPDVAFAISNWHKIRLEFAPNQTESNIEERK